MEHTKNTILTRLAKEGYILSRQRLSIIDALCHQQQIRDVEDFWLGLREKEHISWATVHNTIKLLEYLGCLTRLSNLGRQKQYKLVFPENTDCI